jgi:aminopeptidase
MTIRKFLLSTLLVAGAVAALWIVPVTAQAPSASTRPAPAADAIPYPRLAARIVSALKVQPGERVLLRYDPTTLGPLEPEVRKALTSAGAKVETLNYGPATDLDARLAATDIYIWLPAGDTAVTPPEQRELLAKWLDAGKGRQIHFHWVGGTVDPDGLKGVHSAEFDRIYVDALDIDYAKLSARQDRAIATLRSGEIRVTSPAGTDITFQLGDRPFNKQDGDGSRARASRAQVRVDREVELPAGAVRVAPIEASVNGVIVVPAARFGTTRVTGIRLEFEQGKVVRAHAENGDEALQTFLKSAPGASQFREFGLGFNPRLVPPTGSPYLPYYGYGDAVVRLSLGDATEIGGAVRGGGVRWLFFPNTNVTVGGKPLVSKGRLVPEPGSQD